MWKCVEKAEVGLLATKGQTALVLHAMFGVRGEWKRDLAREQEGRVGFHVIVSILAL